jgi:hypothetical protein
MIPLWQWDKVHLKAWSCLKCGPPQKCVKFDVECDLVQYENKVEIIMRIHLLNLLGENNLRGVRKPS